MCLLKVECGMIDTCIEVYEMGFMISSKKKDIGNTSRMLFYTEHARVPKTFVH